MRGVILLINKQVFYYPKARNGFDNCKEADRVNECLLRNSSDLKWGIHICFEGEQL